MSIEVRVPQLPESVADATLVTWHKQPGDTVQRDENLADLETDKVVLEVPAPSTGTIKALQVANGATVTSGQVLAIIEEGEADAAGSAKQSAKPAEASSVKPAAAPTTAASAPAAGGKLAPAAKRIVEENKLNPADIPGSGRDGRITKTDAQSFADKKPAASAGGKSSAPAKPANAAPAATQASVPAALRAAGTGRQEQRVPMTRLRQRIAQRMVEAQSTQALLTSFNEVDLTAVNELRAKYKERFEKQHGVKLGFMSFFVKASIEGLKRFPVVNATIDGTDIVYHDYYDIGVAVSTERGLMVPIVRNADSKTFADIEKEIAAYAGKAREGTIAIEDLTGGTFTITNGGVFGSLLSTPIVNAPQSAILGMHKIQERPVVVNGQIAVRPMMYLAVTYDHRLIDGREAVQFLVAIKDSLEDPARLLLQI